MVNTMEYGPYDKQCGRDTYEKYRKTVQPNSNKI